jgi:hypothetical protein
MLEVSTRHVFEVFQVRNENVDGRTSSMFSNVETGRNRMKNVSRVLCRSLFMPVHAVEPCVAVTFTMIYALS